MGQDLDAYVYYGLPVRFRDTAVEDDDEEFLITQVLGDEVYEPSHIMGYIPDGARLGYAWLGYEGLREFLYVDGMRFWSEWAEQVPIDPAEMERLRVENQEAVNRLHHFIREELGIDAYPGWYLVSSWG